MISFRPRASVARKGILFLIPAVVPMAIGCMAVGLGCGCIDQETTAMVMGRTLLAVV